MHLIIKKKNKKTYIVRKKGECFRKVVAFKMFPIKLLFSQTPYYLIIISNRKGIIYIETNVT